MLDRLELLVGDKLEKIKQTTVLVVGLGGVGSYAVESLVRSGVGTLILVDHDVVDLTNLNRQLMALQSNIGESKVKVWEKRIQEINPDCQVIGVTQFLTKDNLSLLDRYSIDYIVDACDTIETKKELIRYAQSHHISIISSMGTAQKLDPTKLEITRLDKTSYDPLAKRLRKMLKEEGISTKVTVVSSTEKPIPLSSKTLGSTSFVPSVAGLLCTSYIIRDRIEVKHEND